MTSEDHHASLGSRTSRSSGVCRVSQAPGFAAGRLPETLTIPLRRGGCGSRLPRGMNELQVPSENRLSGGDEVF